MNSITTRSSELQILVDNIIYIKSTSQTYLLSRIVRGTLGTLGTRVHVTARQNLVALSAP